MTRDAVDTSLLVSLTGRSTSPCWCRRSLTRTHHLKWTTRFLPRETRHHHGVTWSHGHVTILSHVTTPARSFLPRETRHGAWPTSDERPYQRGSAVRTQVILIIIACLLSTEYRVDKNGTVFWYALTSSNSDRFSQLFHCQNHEKICNNTITNDPTTQINKEPRVYCLNYCLK